MLPTPVDLTLDEIQSHFGTDEKARPVFRGNPLAKWSCLSALKRAAFALAVAVAFATAGVTNLEAQSTGDKEGKLQAVRGSAEGGVPKSAFFVGVGPGYSFTNFGTQSVFNKGISNVFDEGMLVASGMAVGPPVEPDLASESNFIPMVQTGYFRHFGESNWLWGAKFSYSYLGTTSSVQNLIIPQFGTSTNPNLSSFTGFSVTKSYSVSIYNETNFFSFIGRSFGKTFVYLGGGLSLSQIKGSLNDIVGYATINENLTNISGVPQSTSSTDWRCGAAATCGITYFLSPSWFLDLGYFFTAPTSRTISTRSSFNNPGDGSLAFRGTLIGTYTANVDNTHAVAISINKAF